VKTEIIRLGKRNALYIPKGFVDELEIRPGDRIQLSLEDRTIRIEILGDPLKLALEGKKFASITTDEIDTISLAEQKRHAGNSS
jgi:antitoxin component of MazEF toxin-antitoxin module